MPKVHPMVNTKANPMMQQEGDSGAKPVAKESDKKDPGAWDGLVAGTTICAGESDLNSKRTPQPVTPETPKVASDESHSQRDDDPGSIRTGQTAQNRSSQAPVDQPDLEKTDSSSDQSPTENQQKDHDRRRRSSLSNSRSGKSKKRNSGRYDDVSSSSDDDSSYFASNLPSPKSGRSFSITSTGSVAMNASFVRNSDDLSFSDESEEDAGLPRQSSDVRASAVIAPQHRAVTEPNAAYPKPITRMHSASSLASSESDENSRPRSRTMSASTMSSHSSGNDDGSPELSVNGELSEAAALQHANSPYTEQNGCLLYTSPSPRD